MECPAIYELPDLILGVILIIGFFKGKNSIVGGFYPALLAGLTFLSSSTVQLFLGIHLEVLEFLAMLIFMTIPEKFLRRSGSKRFSYITFGLIVIITSLIVDIKGDVSYFRVGTLLFLSVMMAKVYLHPEVAGEGVAEPLALSSGFALLGVVALVLGFRVFSSFLYFASVLLLMMITIERGTELRART
ncbi:hypothetical protein [Thermococcus sp.]|uniref:hypothetical protein n=1 Tax=Thermococcus sp. TaxID=35749 RepID=UPI00261B2A28|nr:hypothetical protein [Thermococcus sp.]